MADPETWRTVPLKTVILHLLQKRDGLIKEKDLHTLLKREYGGYSETELNKALMTLENQGLIHVSWLTRSERRIQTIDNRMSFLAIGED